MRPSDCTRSCTVHSMACTVLSTAAGSSPEHMWVPGGAEA